LNYPKEAFAWLEERKFNKYSQFGEDGLLEAIFERIGTANKWVMECGAADGVFFSNSKKLIDEEWNAVLIEGDIEQATKCRAHYYQRGNVHTLYAQAETQGVNSFDAILDGSDAPHDLDLAVIDVDGQDYWLFNSLLKYRPRVVMCEYDPNANPDFVPPIDGEGQAGLQAIIRLGIGKLYYPVCATWCNVIFVQQELVHLLASEKKVCDSCNYDFISVGGRTNCNQCTNDRPAPVEREHYGDCPQDQWMAVRGGRLSDAPRCTCGIRGDDQLDTGELDNQPTIIDPPADDAYARSVRMTQQVADVHAGLRRRLTVDGDSYTPPAAKAPFTAPAAPKIVAVTSIPQLGHNVHYGCQLEALSPFGVPVRQCYGPFWGQVLTQGILGILDQDVDYILTMDYDTLFTAKHVADLVSLALANPDVDVIIPCLCKREGNGLCAHTKEQDATKPGVNLNDDLFPIQLGHFGLTLFKVSMFDRLQRPWFMATPDKDGHWGEGHIDADMNFWLNCEASGIKVMLARHVRVGHIEYMATIPNAEDPRKTDYVHVGEWRKWAVLENQVVNDRLQKAKETYV
jgi:hypothetical protein